MDRSAHIAHSSRHLLLRNIHLPTSWLWGLVELFKYAQDKRSEVPPIQDIEASDRRLDFTLSRDGLSFNYRA